MKLTDEQLNRIMAEALGWQIENWPKTIKPDGTRTFGLPDYCSDRNTLPEIWAAVEKQRCWENYIRLLFRFERGSFRLVFEALTAEPRTHIVAALKTMDKWTDGWE